MKILIVDDHKLFLDSMARMISIDMPESTIHKATDGNAAINMLEKLKPDLVLLDIKMPLTNGIDVAEYVNNKHPEIKIIVVTQVDGEAMVLRLVKIVQGFLFKDVDSHEMKECIEAVMNGKNYFCKDVADIIHENMGEIDDLPTIHFKKSEEDMLALMATGKSSKEIAAMLGVNLKKVTRFREDLLKKTKTKNASELVAFVFYNGLSKSKRDALKQKKEKV